MQQTETYKLNLIESSDTFSPEALNANTRKVEEAMIAHEEKVDGLVADLDARLQVFEAKHFAFGTYNGSAPDGCNIELGFRPKAVIVASTRDWFGAVMAVDSEDGQYSSLKLTDTGFSVSSKLVSGPNTFVAFG